jgi:hypothetical protein
MEWITAKYSLDCNKSAAKRAVPLDSLKSIRRTRRIISAGTRLQRREYYAVQLDDSPEQQ